MNATVIAVEATAATVPSAAIASQGGTTPGLLLFLVAAGAIAPPLSANHQPQPETVNIS